MVVDGERGEQHGGAGASSPDVDGSGAQPRQVNGCELCEAVPFTPWFHDDDVCWIAECESCSTPMVVWRSHGDAPPNDTRQHMITQLERVAAEHFGEGEWYIDDVMRQIPTHFHAHARRRWKF